MIFNQINNILKKCPMVCIIGISLMVLFICSIGLSFADVLDDDLVYVPSLICLKFNFHIQIQSIPKKDVLHISFLTSDIHNHSPPVA